jgi:hypothetical protein
VDVLDRGEACALLDEARRGRRARAAVIRVRAAAAGVRAAVIRVRAAAAGARAAAAGVRAAVAGARAAVAGVRAAVRAALPRKFPRKTDDTSPGEK